MNRRAGVWVPAAVWAAVLFFASSRDSVGVDLSGGLDKVAHFGAYLILGLCLVHATVRHEWTPFVAIVLGILYAFTDELHQHFVPGRSVEFADWVADSLGVSAGVMLYLLIWRSRLSAKNDLAAPSAESRPI